MPDGTTHPHPDFTAEACEIVAAQQARRDARLGTGVSWSALTTELEPVETVEAVAYRLTAEHERREAFAVTPRGRFVLAVEALRQDHCAECVELQGYYSRSLDDEREPLNIRAVGACLRILAPMDCVLAQDAELALADLLVTDGERVLEGARV